MIMHWGTRNVGSSLFVEGDLADTMFAIQVIFKFLQIGLDLRDFGPLNILIT